MPCTFSHPFAIVPLHRLCPVRFNLAALVIGSMSPDFAYFVRQFPLARFAHTISGTLIFCLPGGLLTLSIFYLLRQPLCFVLPQPHRVALMPLAAARPCIRLRSFLIAAASVLLGAWTHTIWDSFTHDGGWTVQRIAILSAPLMRIGGAQLSTCYVLQQLSSLGAGIGLALTYFFWLRRQPTVPLGTQDSLSDGWRYLLFVLLGVTAVAIAAPPALRMAALFEGYTAFRVFVFRTGVYSVAVFVPLLAISSTILYAVHRKSV